MPRAKLFLAGPGAEGAFGEGKYCLLETVRREGSLLAAARSLGRGYRKAWGDIRRAEEGLGHPLLVRRRGGSRGGGGSVLTPFAFQLLRAWTRYRKHVFAAVAKGYARHMAPVLLSAPAIAARKESSATPEPPIS